MSYSIHRYPKKNKELAGMIIFNQINGNVLLLENNQGEMDLPKGHVEAGESLLDGAIREVYEETGLHPDKNLDLCHNHVISLPSRKQLTFYLGFTNIKKIKISHEHSNYYWMSPKKAIKLFGKNNTFGNIIRAMYALTKCVDY